MSDTHRRRGAEQAAEKALPSHPDSERFLLGSVLLDGSKFAAVTGAITTEVFSIQKHRTIWQRMSEMAERGEVIDRNTLANELIRYGELESCDGLAYLLSLDDNLPNLDNLNAYVRIVVEKWRLRKSIHAANKTLDQAMSGKYTADEVCLNGQAMLADQPGGYGSSQIESVREYVEAYPGGINTMLNPETFDRGIPTGFAELDEWTSGMHASEIFLIGARPGSGKTAFSSNIAKHVAFDNKSVAVFSLELTKTMFLNRMFCEHAYLSYSRFRAGGLDEEERRRLRVAVSQVMDLPLYIDDTMSLRVADMRVKINKITRTRPLDLLVIDYAQLIKAPKGQRFATENDRISAVCEELKILCKETKVPLLLLSQLNRESEKDKGGGKPKLSQARGGGAFEEVAYVGGCLYREYINRRDRHDLEDQCDLIIDKNRSGRGGTIRLRWISHLMRFESPRMPETAPTSQ